MKVPFSDNLFQFKCNDVHEAVSETMSKKNNFFVNTHPVHRVRTCRQATTNQAYRSLGDPNLINKRAVVYLECE